MEDEDVGLEGNPDTLTEVLGESQGLIKLTDAEPAAMQGHRHQRRWRTRIPIHPEMLAQEVP
jgi:hypothetical protein